MDTLGFIIAASLYGYILVTLTFLILDNRSPQSIMAWMLLFIIFPIGGVVLYILIGRNWRAISKKRKIANQMLDRQLAKVLWPLIRRQDIAIKDLQKSPKINPKLLSLLHRNSPSLLTINNSMKVIQSGKEKFDLMMKDLKAAKRFIHMEYYVWNNDSLTNKIKDILIQKSQSGVEVRILYDALASFFLSKKYIKEMRAAGILIYPYFNFLSLFKFHTVNYRLHRKIVVIDGKIGYTGGMNMGKEYVDGGRYKFWRDTHMRIVGEAVSGLQGVFTISWFNTTKERLFNVKYFPQQQYKGRLPIHITTSGPDSKWAAIRQLYFSMISSAHDKVYIQSPYFIPEPSVYEALITAGLSGVDVRVMLTGIADKRIPYWAAFTYLKNLLEAGVKIYHYKKGFLHAKTVNVDSSFCSIGTANMDIRSFHLNYELNTLIYDEGVAQRLEQAYIEDLKHCQEFTIKQYNNISVFFKFRNSLSRLLSPIL